MIPTNQIKNFIKSFEKCKLKAYKVKDDKVTIGWGNTYYEDGTPIKLGDVITQERADALFEFVLAKISKHVNSLIKVNLTQNQYDGILSFDYNTGSLHKSTLLKLINKNPNDKDIPHWFNVWCMPGTIFEEGLKARRAAEVEIYLNNKYVNHV
jgi:lysozyme